MSTLNIQLSYGLTTQGEGSWRLRIEDPTSGALVVEAELSYEDFARLVGTTDYQVTAPGRILTQNSDKWGKDYEFRTIVVEGLGTDTWEDRHAMIAAAIAEQDGDGWFLDERVDSDGSRRSTGYNQHRDVHGVGYKVSIGRYVDHLDGVEEMDDQ